MFDLFISHASEDNHITDKIYENLKDKLWVWYDNAVLTFGTSITKVIDKGLASSKMGLVVLSDNFIKKDWPERELSALFHKETNGINRIIPILYNLTIDDIKKRYPLLSDIKAGIISDDDLKIDEIYQAVVSRGIPNIPIKYVVKSEDIPAIKLQLNDFEGSGWDEKTLKKSGEDWQYWYKYKNSEKQIAVDLIIHLYKTIEEAIRAFPENRQKYASNPPDDRVFAPNVGEESFGYISGFKIEVVTFRTANLLIHLCYRYNIDIYSIKQAEKIARKVDQKIRNMISNR